MSALSMMQAESFALLRHVEVHGPRSRAELAAGLARPVKDVSVRLNNLVSLGYLAKDETTMPINFALTNKARAKLASPDVPKAPSAKPRKPRERPDPHAHLQLRRKEAARPAARSAYAPPRHQRYVAIALYRASEYQPSTRPGAMDAFALPSRMGDSLHYRDGRVTDMAGNPVT